MTSAMCRPQNHCCAPSMYTKVLDIDGRPRLVFFARFDIRPGQELTYDYRFKVKHCFIQQCHHRLQELVIFLLGRELTHSTASGHLCCVDHMMKGVLWLHESV